MTKNMGKVDKGIRLLLSIVLITLLLTNVLVGTAAVAASVAIVILTLTSFVSFCPLYRILGINSCTVK